MHLVCRRQYSRLDNTDYRIVCNLLHLLKRKSTHAVARYNEQIDIEVFEKLHRFESIADDRVFVFAAVRYARGIAVVDNLFKEFVFKQRLENCQSTYSAVEDPRSHASIFCSK